jgi:hypothetical protein
VLQQCSCDYLGHQSVEGFLLVLVIIHFPSCTLGKLTIPNFDGSSSSTARAWVQKLDTYFQLNPMIEADAIKLATLHLDGEAHDWWYHGLVTLGHNNITTYVDFTQRLLERFEKKDPELHFRELAQLKQTGSVEAFIAEFQRVVVMVTDVSESRLIMLFVEALAEPLRGWVKAYKPTTLQDAIGRTRDLQEAVPKNRFPARPIIPLRDKDKKPFQREWPRREKMDEDTRRELRRKKLCFTCQEPWVPGHRCAGKAKAHYIEVYSDSGDDEDDLEQVHEEELRAAGEEQLQDDIKGGIIATLSGVPRFHTFRVRGVTHGHKVGVLIDGGATHNFIDVAWVTRRGIPSEEFQCCISRVGESVGEGPECNFSATSAENVGKCRKTSKKYKKNIFFNFFNFLNL